MRVDFGPGPDGRVQVTIDPASRSIPEKDVLCVEPAQAVIAPGATADFDVICTTNSDLSSGRVLLYGTPTPVLPDSEDGKAGGVKVHLVERNGTGAFELVAAGSYHPWAHVPDLAMGLLKVYMDLNIIEPRLGTDANDDGLKLTVHADKPPTDRRSTRALTVTNHTSAPLVFSADAKQPFDIGEPVPSVDDCFLDTSSFPIPIRRGRKVRSRNQNLATAITPSWDVVPVAGVSVLRIQNCRATAHQTAIVPKNVAGTEPYHLQRRPRQQCHSWRSSRHPAQRSLHHTQVIRLPPNESVELPVMFHEPEEQEAAVDDYSVLGTLVLTYANRDVQTIPLHADVIHPELTVDPPALDFGPVHVLAPKPLRVVLTNPTGERRKGLYLSVLCLRVWAPVKPSFLSQRAARWTPYLLMPNSTVSVPFIQEYARDVAVKKPQPHKQGSSRHGGASPCADQSSAATGGATGSISTTRSQNTARWYLVACRTYSSWLIPRSRRRGCRVGGRREGPEALFQGSVFRRWAQERHRGMLHGGASQRGDPRARAADAEDAGRDGDDGPQERGHAVPGDHVCGAEGARL